MIRIIIIWVGIFSLYVTPSFAQETEDKPVEIKTGIPEGFADLLEPQLTLVDVYYNGQRVGSSMASYTPDSLQFEAPQEVLSMLANIDSPELMLPMISQPLLTNSALVCFYQGQANCGILAPDNIGIIFDESRLRVDVFVNPKFQKRVSLKVSKYLPESTSGPAMINSLSIAATGGDGRDDFHTARLSSIVSFENYRIISDIESDQELGTRLDRLSFVYEYKDLAYQAGSFRSLSQPSGFFQQRDFLGVRIQNTLSSRTDLEQVSGSEIYLFLNERSRIELYKDQQLIDTQIHQAGNIQLDTREFPEGAYNIEVKITGNSGRERTETHFYSKSLLLPPKDETLYYVEAGYPEDEETESLPQAKSENMVRLGMVSRPTDYMGWSANLIKGPEESSLEVGSFWLGNQVELQTSHAINDEEEYANYYLLSIRRSDFVLSASYRRTHNHKSIQIDPDYQLIAPSARQTTFSFGMPIGESLLNLYARNSEDINQEKYDAIGLSWRKNIFRSSHSLLDWTIDASKENGDSRIVTGLTWRFLANPLNLDTRLDYQRTNPKLGTHDTYINKHAKLTYRNNSESFGRATASIEVNETEELLNAGLQAEVSNDYGYGRLTFDRLELEPTNVQPESISQNNYSLTSRINFVTGGGKLVLGGDRQNQAGVMLNLESIEVEGLDFSVVVNGIERTRVSAGSSTFIPLSPYETYSLSLTPRGETLVRFDNSPREFTLYPGNVEKLTWEIESVKVIVMQLLQNDESAFANARLSSETLYARTDEMGWVQMELSKPGELEFKNTSGSCRIVIDKEHLKDNVNFLGTVDCSLSKQE